MRAILIAILLTVATQVFADYGYLYFFKCKITTSDTVITGYIVGPYEYLSDTILTKFKQDNIFFEQKLLKDLNDLKERSETITVNDFVHIQKYADGTALFESENPISLEIKDIKSLLLYDIISFHFEPSRVISSLIASDTTWTNRQPIKTITDNREINDCCPVRYLIYKDIQIGEQIVNNAISEKNREKRKQLLRELRDHKIIAIRVCWCG